jgi:hypothetical protein
MPLKAASDRFRSYCKRAAPRKLLRYVDLVSTTRSAKQRPQQGGPPGTSHFAALHEWRKPRKFAPAVRAVTPLESRLSRIGGEMGQVLGEGERPSVEGSTRHKGRSLARQAGYPMNRAARILVSHPWAFSISPEGGRNPGKWALTRQTVRGGALGSLLNGLPSAVASR